MDNTMGKVSRLFQMAENTQANSKMTSERVKANLSGLMVTLTQGILRTTRSLVKAPIPGPMADPSPWRTGQMAKNGA